MARPRKPVRSRTARLPVCALQVQTHGAAMPNSPTASRSASRRSTASKQRSTPFRDGPLAGSDPAAAGGMGLSGSIPHGAN
jgi:hypothetical protein